MKTLIILLLVSTICEAQRPKTIVTGNKYLYTWDKFDPKDPFEKTQIDTVIVTSQLAGYVQWTYPRLASTRQKISDTKTEFLAHVTELHTRIPFAKTPTIGIADESALYAMDNDSVFFKPCTGKRNYIGKYDKKTNSILLK